MDEIREQYNGLTLCATRTGSLYKLVATKADGKPAGRCKAYIATSVLNGATVKALALGALASEPDLRRLGLARQCFKMLGQAGQANNCLVSYLHPFSFSYYRTMGYERVSDHRILELPISTLSFLPRYPDLIRYRVGDNMEDLAVAHNKFAKGRNGMFLRNNATANPDIRVCESYMALGEGFEYDCKGILYYLLKDSAGEPCGYLKLRKEMEQRHHNLFGKLYVDEICYDSPDALRKLLGFLRMYDGEVDTVVFTNCGMAPEVEHTLREYKYTKITVVPDIAARVMNVPGLLEAMVYPKEPGRFTIRVTDCEKSPFCKDNTEGTWHVEYADAKATVTRLADNAPCDMLLPIPAFTQLIHGFDSHNAESARYLEGVEIYNDCPDFFRAFPKRPCGLYDLF